MARSSRGQEEGLFVKERVMMDEQPVMYEQE